MDVRKIRRLPPVVVSGIVAAAVIVSAIATISSQAEIKAGATQGGGEPETAAANPEATEVATVVHNTEKPQTTTQESTYESLIYSRDWDADDSEILLKIAMAEAEGESVEGKALVMLVVLNRVWSDGFPDSIEAVVFQPKQFSPVCEEGRYYTTEPDEGCYEALWLVMSGWDESDGALYFESCENDSWHSRNLEFLYQVGNHKFYK